MTTQLAPGQRWVTFLGRPALNDRNGVVLKGATWLRGNRIETRNEISSLKYQKGKNQMATTHARSTAKNPSRWAYSDDANGINEPTTAPFPDSPSPSKPARWAGRDILVDDTGTVTGGPSWMIGMSLAELQEIVAEHYGAKPARKPGEPQQYDETLSPDEERTLSQWKSRPIPPPVAKEARDLTLANREVGRPMPYSRALAIATNRYARRKTRYSRQIGEQTLYRRIVDYVRARRDEGIDVSTDTARRHVLLGMT